jgi:uncharacterized membrane protein
MRLILPLLINQSGILIFLLALLTPLGRYINFIIFSLVAFLLGLVYTRGQVLSRRVNCDQLQAFISTRSQEARRRNKNTELTSSGSSPLVTN